MKSKQPFSVGDKVLCSFLSPGESNHSIGVIRNVTAVIHTGEVYTGKYGCTGWVVSADGGMPCPTCGCGVAPIPLIDSGYFSKYEL